ncbi:MAG: ribonuclease R, partial [Oceanospirillaceae bacterium]
MNVLGKVDHSLQREQIARTLDLKSPEQKEALRRRLRAMERDGQLMFDKRKGYHLIDAKSLVTGVINIHPAGFGFVDSDTSEKGLYLAKNQLNHVFDGDVVQLYIKSTEGQKSYNQLIKVIEHKTTHITGELTRKGNTFYLIPDNAKVLLQIEVDGDFLLGAKTGQCVNTKIVEYPDYQYNTLVEVTEVLGYPQDAGMEIKLALRRHGITESWDEQLVACAKQFGDDVAAQDKVSRVDYRQLPFVTIDGSDAKDFDDAIYCEKTEAGNWRLLVAIADVSHYIKPGDILDEEAQARGTSIYFPGHVVPMLPHSLSDGLCSLKPKVDRLVMVCDMTINLKGKVVNCVFTEGVIHSHARLTYDQANAAVTAQSSQLAKQVDRKILPHLQCLYQLYQALSYARGKRGAIEFSSQEQHFNLTDERKIASMSPVVRNVAHKMVEEFMLCANVATAEFLNKHKIPTLFRVHSGPQQKKLAHLRAFLSDKGLSLGGRDKPTSEHYNQLLDNIGQRSDASTIKTMLLRSQSRAQYSVKNEGHFG